MAALALTLALALALGLVWRAGQGRMRVRRHADRLDPRLLESLGVRLGDRATLLQFSSAFCQPCRATRQVLSRVSVMVAGVSHIEVDAESHLDAVRALSVLRTPTTLILDPDGREISRATGIPRVPDVVAAIDTVARSASPAPAPTQPLGEDE